MRPFRRQRRSSPQKKTPHHYVLAHLALKQAAALDPYAFFSMMGSRRRKEFLDELWLQICASCDEEGAASFTAKDITVHTTIIGKFPTTLIVMPEPHFTAEAYMACVILQVPIDDLEALPEKPEFRYFTLEKGTCSATGADRTVLCAWEGDTHLNFGDGPEPTPAAFVAKLEDMIAMWAPAGPLPRGDAKGSLTIS